MVRTLGLGACLALVVAGCGFWGYRHYRIPSVGMEPTLLRGDRITVDPKAYHDGRTPQPGDVIVFAWPKDPSKTFVKRVVAIAGQTVEDRDGRLYVDGREADDRHAAGDAPHSSS